MRMSRYERFDRARIQLRALAERGHDLRAADCLPLAPPDQAYAHAEFDELISGIVKPRQQPLRCASPASATSVPDSS
jgi:hypothetical protein